MNKPLSFLLIVSLVLTALFCFMGIAAAGDRAADDLTPRYGWAIIAGNSADPVSDIRFFQLSAFGMWDHDKVWPYWAPEEMRFKVEVNLGATVSPDVRMVLSADMMGQYYLKPLYTPRFSPYVTSGIGVIYTDFQVRDKESPPEEMGSRVNFNPHIGFGTDINVRKGPPFFAEFRLSHISNADLNEDNRGLNSVVLIFGRFF